jgi:hypothetical protein
MKWPERVASFVAWDCGCVGILLDHPVDGGGDERRTIVVHDCQGTDMPANVHFDHRGPENNSLLEKTTRELTEDEVRTLAGDIADLLGDGQRMREIDSLLAMGRRTES